jgi:putative transposase
MLLRCACPGVLVCSLSQLPGASSQRGASLGRYLSLLRKLLTFTDGCGIGYLKLVGSKNQHIEIFPVAQIKRVRLVSRADGYYCQFAVQADRRIEHAPTNTVVGIDVGLTTYYTDSLGATVANPRYFRKAEKRLKRLHRQVSRKQHKSANRNKARHKLARAYLKVRRQREDFARKTANTLVSSCEPLCLRRLADTEHAAQ